MSLNPEPSAPDERDAQHLAPKSYADAAEEALKPESHASIHDYSAVESHLPTAEKIANGVKPNGIKSNGIKSNGIKPNGVDILRIVPTAETNGNDTSHFSDANDTHNANDTDRDPNRDFESYEGAGTDETPKSPVPKGSRRKGSRSSMGSIGRTQGVRIASHGHEKSHSSSSSNSNDSINGHTNGNGTIKTENNALTTVKATAELEKDSQPVNSELKAGRQAGAGWATSKIRFAPMNIPLQRRLQTLAVLMHTLSIAGGLAIFFMLCSIPLLWPILLPYTVYVLFSNAGTSGELSFRSERLRRLPVWSLFASYFPARLHRSQELEPTRKYIFGYHPHGIISHGAFAAFATEALGFSQLFPGITNALLTLDSNFRYPIYREYALRLGMASVSRESCENILSKGGHNGEGMGRAITIVVGGARESLDARPGSIRLVLRRRKGFVKMAIRTGADLVPVLAFGENDVYDQVDSESHPLIHKFQMLVKKLMGFTVPLFHARGVFNYDVGMMPYRRPINIVVGKPIRVVQNSHPESDYMDEVHDKYIKELMRLWEDHKDTFAKQRTGELEIVE